MLVTRALVHAISKFEVVMGSMAAGERSSWLHRLIRSGWEKVGMSRIQERGLWWIIVLAPFFTLGFIFTAFILGTMASPVSTRSVSGPDS